MVAWIFCGSIGIILFVGGNACKGKTTCIWIYPNPAQVGPKLGGVVALLSFKKKKRERNGYILSFTKSKALVVCSSS